jgi:hypothetical protein
MAKTPTYEGKVVRLQADDIKRLQSIREALPAYYATSFPNDTATQTLMLEGLDSDSELIRLCIIKTQSEILRDVKPAKPKR